MSTKDANNPLREAVRACRSEIVSSAVLSFFINLLMLTLPFYVMSIFQRVLQSQSEATLIALTVIALLAMVVTGILTLIRGRILTHASAKFDTLLGERVHTALIRYSVHTTENRNVQPLRDLSQVRNLLAGSDLQTLFDAPWTPVFLAVIFLLHPLMGWVATIGAAVLLILAIINDQATRRPLEVANKAAQKAYGVAQTNVRNAEVIEGMGMLGNVMGRWRKHNVDVLVNQDRATDLSAVLSASSKTVRMIIQIMITAVGAWLVIEREIHPGAMMASLFILGRTMAPVEVAIRTWKNVASARTAYRRLDKLLSNLPPPGDVMKLPAPEGRLQLENVVHIPPGAEKPVLKGVSFTLEPGESLGIVGPSASGKSTLARLLVGVWKPTNGTVRLDAADVAQWDSRDLGQYVGYLPQEVELLDGTVRENIARMTEAEADEIVAAAQMAGVHEMILHLPKGYESEIGEGGSFLSGGQRQRIALARALFRNPRLLVLDEPNANLDAEGEEALAKALTQAKAAGSTVVVIAHRPTVLANVDKILVLRQGRAEMFGPRQEVLAKIMPQAQFPRVVSQQS